MATACKNIKTANKTLLLEAVAGINDTKKIAEVMTSAETNLFLGKELGFIPKELVHLQKEGILETTIYNTIDHLSLSGKESLRLFEAAQDKLEPYRNKFMSENEARSLIRSTGLPFFERPKGIPNNYRVKLSKSGVGIIYFHPQHNHISIRVMPGKPHSPFPRQQRPYVIYRKYGKTLDKFGNVVDSSSPEAHIPIEEFIFTE